MRRREEREEEMMGDGRQPAAQGNGKWMQRWEMTSVFRTGDE